ncbi:MAG TPA: hypothetical protein VME45_14315 [Stellaceae bacterium]|nr:hypothetical protein [Stellaceae bacterium]
MIPETCEPLSVADNILIARINLCCAAFGLFVFALLADELSIAGKALVLLASAVVVFLACHMDTVFRRFDRGHQGGGLHVSIDHYLILL